MSKINLKNIDLIILDFDGPINDLIQGKILAIKSLCRLLRIKLSRKSLVRIINYIDQVWEIRRIIDYQKNLKRVIKQLKLHDLIKMGLRQKNYFTKEFSSFLTRNQSCNKTLIQVVRKIKKRYRNIKVCIYSRQTKKDIQKFFNKFKININLFDGIYGREDFKEPKPSIKNLEIICRKLKVAPKKAIMIGDNVVVDLMPAKLLGMQTILYSRFIDHWIQFGQGFRRIFEKI